MLYKDLQDCDDCPFFGEFCKGGMTCSPSGDPIEPPCVNWNDNDDLDVLYHEAVEGERRYEEAQERRWKREQEIKRKKEERAKKAKQARWAVWSEQREITQLRKKIKNNERLLSYANAMAKATNFANEMFGYEERVAVRERNPLELENESLQKRIDELIIIKKEKLKEHRKKQKEIANGQS
jgi:hypothetical protein